MRGFKTKTVNEIKDYLLECMGDTKEEALREIRRYRNDFKKVRDYNIYSYGNILPYYSQIRYFLVNVCEEKKVSDDNETMCNRFKEYIRVAVDELLEENKEIEL